MKLVQYRPLGLGRTNSPLTELMDEFWGKDISNVRGSNSATFIPATNIVKNEDSYRIDVAAPGFNKEHFHLDVEDELLTLKAEVKENKEESKENFTRREFSINSFNRSFTLPDGVDVEGIEANYNQGVLSVVIPLKVEEMKKKSRLINIS